MNRRILTGRQSIPAIDDRFGTPRGLVRLVLANLKYRLGGMRLCGAQDNRPARRLVFVCQGNICRSAFAEAVAKRLGAPVASFGLRASAGGEAPPAEAREAAAALGYDLSDHRSRPIADYRPEPGDLILAMEYSQIVALHALHPATAKTLLGLFGRPRLAHLHDPHTLGLGYHLACFGRIERMVERAASGMALRAVERA
jgi:protein-tyrosine phosphatase